MNASLLDLILTIYGDIYGHGNEKVAVSAYVEAYEEIKKYEADNGLIFDYIFHASGTGTTQSGLICGSLICEDQRKIVGISIARTAEQNKQVIKTNISKYLNEITNSYIEREIYCEDKYVISGYGDYNNEIINIIKEVLNKDGISLDTTYTGKAFWGMTEFLKENSIKDKKVLFLHTGSGPLFFDNLSHI